MREEDAGVRMRDDGQGRTWPVRMREEDGRGEEGEGVTHFTIAQPVT
jgi:hypothetical protein